MTWAADMAASAALESHVIIVSKSPWSHAPMTLKVSQNTRPIMPIKAGIAVYFPVRILSILALRICSLLSLGLTTVLWHRS